jgi:hypothetical protein
MYLQVKILKQIHFIIVFSCLVFLATPRYVWAGDAKSVAMFESDSGGTDAENSSTALPDLFTGAMSYSIPIEVPVGRNGMNPNLALSYRSSNRNGWLGVGWDLSVGAIQRSVKKSLSYFS